MSNHCIAQPDHEIPNHSMPCENHIVSSCHAIPGECHTQSGKCQTIALPNQTMWCQTCLLTLTYQIILHVMPNYIILWILCQTIPSHAVPYFEMANNTGIFLCQTIPYHVVQNHAVSCSYHVMPLRTILCQTIPLPCYAKLYLDMLNPTFLLPNQTEPCQLNRSMPIALLC